MIALVASMLLLAPWTGYAGSVKITVNDDPEVIHKDGKVVFSEGQISFGIYFDTDEPRWGPGVICRMSRPLGIVDGKLEIVETIVQYNLGRIVAFNDSNEDDILDDDEETSHIDLARTWNMSGPTEVDQESVPSEYRGDLWSIEITSPGEMDEAFDSISITFTIARSTGKGIVPVPIYKSQANDNSSQLSLVGWKNKTLRAVQYTHIAEVNISGWAPENGTTSYALQFDYITGESLDPLSSMDNPFEEQGELRSWPNGSLGFLNESTTINGSSDPIPLDRSYFYSDYVGSVASQLSWHARHEESTEVKTEGQVDGFLPTGHGPEHIMSKAQISALIGSDGANLESFVYSLDELEEEDPDLKLGFTFYLPLIFITTLVSATVVINYHRRDME